jgi:integrase
MFRRGNGKLYIEYEAYGKTVQKSTRLQDTPQNRAFVKKEVIPALQAKILTGEFSKDKPQSFAYYSKLYLREKEHLKSYPQIVSQINKLNDYFKDIQTITQLKKQHIKEWVQDRLEINTPKTVREYLTSIRGVIHVAIDLEHIKDNVADNIKLPTHQKKVIEPFSQEEVIKLLNNANDWFRLYLAIGFYTGMRTGEIMALTRADINLTDRVIHIKRSVTKNKVTTPKTQMRDHCTTILFLEYFIKYE